MNAGQTFTGIYSVSDEDGDTPTFELKVCIYAFIFASLYNKCHSDSIAIHFPLNRHLSLRI